MQACEKTRLETLDHYDILDTREEECFDRITRLAQKVFDVPIATVAFLDGHREWFKSRQGIEPAAVDREPTLCNIAIQQAQPLIIEDTLRDPRFAANSFVVGKPKVRFYAGFPLAAPDGSNIGILCVMDTKPRTFSAADVATLADLAGIVLTELELRVVATTDALTGTLSRRGFMAEANRALALAVRHRLSLSCIVFDLDHFKTINDRHGHATGDRVLRATAQACSTALRTSDIFGRIGGEEFAVLLPHTSREDALGVAEKLRAAVAQQELGVPESGAARLTASFGVASFDRASPDVAALLAHADNALYAAKASGRNKCCAWTPAPEPITAGGRRRVLKAGRISFNLGRSSIDCTVRSLARDGAGLDVTSTADVPDTFKLRIDTDDLSMPCKVVSRRSQHLEVAFA